MENTQAILLLTSHLTRPSDEVVKPLTPHEWGRFAFWLNEKGLFPSHLLHESLDVLLNGWIDKSVSQDRIRRLLQRSKALDLALEKWHQAGIWVLTRSDVYYPGRLKVKLKTVSPPVLFGVGNRSLLNSVGLAVVGSRKAPHEDLLFAEQLGEKAAKAKVTVISGAAKGIDESSMLGALGAGGGVVGILPGNLSSAASSPKWGKKIESNNLALVSPFHPEADFSAGNAMVRNQYIHCMSDGAMVVHSGTKGGSWSGAVQNLSNDWTPLWVKPTNDRKAGNQRLVEMGGLWSEALVEDVDIYSLINTSKNSPSPKVMDDLFA